MIDVKKLITGFLILAVAAVCSGLIFSLASRSAPAASVPQAAITATIASSSINAFLPTEDTQPSDEYVATATLAATSSDPNNLTDALATAFVNGVADANPNGPITDNGQSVIAHPDETAIADQVVSVPSLANFTPPDWDFEAESQPIKYATSSSEQSIANYSQSLSEVINTGLIASNVQTIVSNPTPDPSQANFVASQMEQTLSDAIALPVPKPLTAFQESLITMLVYEKNELQLAANVGDDPVKTSLILQDEETKYDAAVQNFQTQLQNASALQGFSFGTGPQGQESSAVSFLDGALDIQTAHAQWLTFDASDFANWIESFAKNIALQILKNTLIALIQRKVLAWVQGSGAPRFITSWGTTLISSYEQSALNAINSQMSCGTFPAFIPQIKLTLGTFYQPGNNACANQFQAALGANTFQQFQNNFQNGGWVAFGASTLPSGNLYSSQFFAAQIAENTAQNSKQATLAKATAAQGQKGDEVCDDGSDPNNGEHTVCENPDGPDYTINTSSSYDQGNETCGAGDTPVVYANDGVCSDGTEPTVTTPGVFTGFGVSSALDSSPKLVTAANDITGLLNALLGSLLNSLASLAVNTAANGVNNALSGSGGITSIPPTAIQGGGTSTIATVPLGCNPLTQTVSSTFPATLGAVGGTLDADGNPPTYNWASSDGQDSTGYIFSPIYDTPGTYTVTISDSVPTDAPATCTIIVH